MALLDQLLNFKPESGLSGVGDAMMNREKLSAGIAHQKMQIEVQKAELENKRAEAKTKKNDYFWSALDKASKFKGKTRSSIMKAIPAIIQDMTGQPVSEEVAQAFLDMAGDADNSLLDQIDMKRAYADPDYRLKATQVFVDAGMADNALDAIGKINSFFGPENAQARADAAANVAVTREAGLLGRTRATEEGKTEREKVKAAADAKKSADKEDNEFAKRAENYITDPNWYKQWAMASPEERVQMRSELTPVMKKADNEARKFGSKQVELALKTETKQERVYFLNRMMAPDATDAERAMGERIRDENLAKSAEGKKLLEDAKGANAMIGLGGGEGLKPEETKALLDKSGLSEPNKKAISDAQQRKLESKAKSLQKKAAGAKGALTQKQSFDIVQKLQEKADKYNKDADRLKSARTIISLVKNSKGPILEQSIIPQYMNMVADAPSILRPEELKVFYSQQGIAGTIESYIKRLKGEGGLSKPSMSEIKRVAVLLEKLALKSYRSRIAPLEAEVKLQGIDRGRVFSPEIEQNIAAFELSDRSDNIMSGKKTVSMRVFEAALRNKFPNGATAEQRKSLMDLYKSKNVRFK